MESKTLRDQDPFRVSEGTGPYGSGREASDAIRLKVPPAHADALARCSTAHDLARIEAALERLDAGSYGYCQGCGSAIGVTRLDGDPAAALCLACADQAAPVA
jgi:RNA polymerase-binding transcription factor DksA